MLKTIFSVKQENYVLKLLGTDNNKLLESKWFMEFGKMASEILNTKNEVCYSVTKKFKFWIWKMTYIIEGKNELKTILIAKNKQNTIFECQVNTDEFEIIQHYKQQKSVYKNGNKIAEIDQSFKQAGFEKLIKIQVLENESIELIFLLFSALQIGENGQKPLLKSQKTLIPNKESWI